MKNTSGRRKQQRRQTYAQIVEATLKAETTKAEKVREMNLRKSLGFPYLQ